MNEGTRYRCLSLYQWHFLVSPRQTTYHNAMYYEVNVIIAATSLSSMFSFVLACSSGPWPPANTAPVPHRIPVAKLASRDVVPPFSHQVPHRC